MRWMERHTEKEPPAYGGTLQDENQQGKAQHGKDLDQPSRPKNVEQRYVLTELFMGEDSLKSAPNTLQGLPRLAHGEADAP
jgi:hypothetical protein